MEKILLLGASGHARLIINTVEKEGRFDIVGILDDNKAKEADCLGYKVLGKISDLTTLAVEYGTRSGIVAIGDNWVRQEVARRVSGIMPDFMYVSTVHPSAQIARNVCIGEGTVIMAAAAVNAGAWLGKHSYISTKPSLDHDSVLGDFASLGPGATVGGDVRIGTGTAIALGANVIHGIQVGEHTVIGAGATVVRDMPEHVVAYGVPARIARTRAPGDKYF